MKDEKKNQEDSFQSSDGKIKINISYDLKGKNLESLFREYLENIIERGKTKN